MKQIGIVAVVLACSLAGSGCSSERDAYRTRGQAAIVDTLALMTKQDVIALSKAGVGSDVIIGMMHASDSYFHLRTRDVIQLADSGVSNRVIGAMINPEEPSLYADSSGGYYYTPPYYWYAGYPYWYPWYSPFYFGFSAGYYRPFYFPRLQAVPHGFSGHHGFYRGYGFGSFRAGGRRR
jgi:hypothetical protein